MLAILCYLIIGNMFYNMLINLYALIFTNINYSVNGSQIYGQRKRQHFRNVESIYDLDMWYISKYICAVL